MADDVMLENDVPAVSGEMPTRESLLAEARALGKGFSEVAAPPAAIVADAEEMLEGEADLPLFEASGFPVTIGHFMRIRLLKNELLPRTALRERNVEVRKKYTAEAHVRRDTLIAFQRRIKRRARAARLPTALFSIGRINTKRLAAVLWRVEEIALHTRDQLGRFAQQDLVRQLVDETLALIEVIKSERRKLGLMNETGVGETRLQQQIERLLLDAMRYVGAQGMALFDTDRERDTRYRLDHVYGQRTPDSEPDDAEPELPPVEPDDSDA